MCGVKLVHSKHNEELMEMLGLKKTLDKMANGVRSYGHEVRKEYGNALMKTLTLVVYEQRKRGRPKQT